MKVMLTNFHMHTTFCDGKNTAEEMVIAALEKGFSSIGFSGHGYTEFDLRYCMKDQIGYEKEIRRLKEKYAKEIQIYLGIEEDAHAPVDRRGLDYIIGSSHYMCVDGKCHPLDSNYEYFSTCLALFGGDALKLAESYYRHFCEYIAWRKPDVIGHFDLMTKFDETKEDLYLHNEKYWDIAKKYLLEALKNDCIFEVNTGLMIRGFRSMPCPHEKILYWISKNGGRVTLSSDSHNSLTISDYFPEMRKLLKEIGFSCVYALYDNEWKEDYL